MRHETEKVMKKNIVVVSFDDAIAYWHYKRIFRVELQTPNLDKICAVSTAFHAAYCQSPLCGPSRASFMSAQPPHKTGVLKNEIKVFDMIRPEDIWTYRLKQDGYFCSSGGKVHHGYKPLPPEIHDVLYSDERKYFSADMRKHPDVNAELAGGIGGGISTTDPEDDSTYYDWQSTESFIKFLSEYQGDAPFYREVGFFSPHKPFMTPKRFKDLYKGSDFEYPPEWEDEIDPARDAPKPYLANFKTHKARYWKLSVRNYFSAMSHGDYHLGRVWETLQASVHAKNTIVIVLTDHGLHLGENRRFGKSTLLEQVANVPLIIYDPETPEAKTIKDSVALIDVGPTVMEMVGLPPLANCIGNSLVPLMNGTESWPDRPVPTLQVGGATIRKGPYRFTRHENGDTELHDIVSDWWQKRPLGSDHPAYQDMHAAHLDCCREYGFGFDQMKES
jgi:choline-sulfatase